MPYVKRHATTASTVPIAGLPLSAQGEPHRQRRCSSSPPLSLTIRTPPGTSISSGSGSGEDLAIYLRYYADAEERSLWAVEYPEMSMPAREKLPYLVVKNRNLWCGAGGGSRGSFLPRMLSLFPMTGGGDAHHVSKPEMPHCATALSRKRWKVPVRSHELSMLAAKWVSKMVSFVGSPGLLT